MKLEEKLKATKWRKKGMSYKEILQKISVSKSTLSLWLRDIPLSKEQQQQLLNKKQQGANRGAKKRQEDRIEKTKIIIKAAEKEAREMYNNPLFLIGLVLYWAEGDKSDIIEQVKFTNSDPILVKLMMKWFLLICHIPKEKIRINIHIHTLHCRKNIEEYWSKITNIPLTQFYKTQIKPTTLRQRRNHLYNGTCAITILSRELFRKIKGWKIGITKIQKVKITAP